MAQIDGKYMVVAGTSYKVKIPWQATPEQLAATRHRVEWLANHNGVPFPIALLEEFVAAKIPTIVEWQRNLAAARAAPQPVAPPAPIAPPIQPALPIAICTRVHHFFLNIFPIMYIKG